MSSSVPTVRPLLRVAIPVAVSTILIALALINIVVVGNYQSAAPVDDGVLWVSDGGAALNALEVSSGSPAAAAGLRRGDTLLAIDGLPVASRADVDAALERMEAGGSVTYAVSRGVVDDLISVRLALAPGPRYDLYYPLAAVGIFGLLVGASVRLRRRNDPATLHFFWLTAAFFAVFAFTPTGEFTRKDLFFSWMNDLATVLLPPLFFHFALVFPERPHAWVRPTPGSRRNSVSAAWIRAAPRPVPRASFSTQTRPILPVLPATRMRAVPTGRSPA